MTAQGTMRHRFVFIGLMALGLSMVMSLCMSMVFLGLDKWTIARWLKAWGIALLVAYPAALLWAPVAQRLTQRLLR
jgi:hypothetical protein